MSSFVADGNGSSPPRRWNSGWIRGSRDCDAVCAMLDAAGYAETSGGGGLGTYDVWRDVEPRSGSNSFEVHVVEDPARPIVDQLIARFGGGGAAQPMG